MKSIEKTSRAFRWTRHALGLVLALAQPVGGQTAASVESITGWRSDIDAYLAQLHQQHYVLKERTLPDSLLRAAERLRALVPSVSDERMLAELQRLAAKAGDGHNAIFAGEPSSSRPNFVGEENVIMLPWSGAICSISNRAHENIPGDRRQWIAPTVPASLSSRDYFAGRDPVLDALLRDIATHVQ